MNPAALTPLQLGLTILACLAALVRDANTQPLIPVWITTLIQAPALLFWLHARWGWFGLRIHAERTHHGLLTAFIFVAAVAIAVYRGSLDPWNVVVAIYLGGLAFLEWARHRYESLEAAMDKPIDALHLIIRPWIIGLILLTIGLAIPLATKSSVPDYRHNFLLHILNCALTATSSICLIGTSPYSIADDFSLFGHALLMLTTLLSGMALSAIGLAIARPFLSRPLSLASVWKWMIGLQAIAILALVAAWNTTDAPTSLSRVGWSAVHVADATWNTGYTLRPNGLADYLANPFVFSIITTLAIIGSIGMPIVLDLVLPRRKESDAAPWKPWKRLPNWEAGAAFLLLLGVAGLLFLFETRGFLPENLASSRPFDLGSPQVPLREEAQHAPRWRMAVFVSATLRSAGLQSIPLVEGTITWPSYAVLLVGMIVGGSAMGVAGGLRSTAFVLGLICLVHPRRMWSDNENAVRWRTLRRLATLIAAYLLLAGAGTFVMYTCTAGTAHELIFDTIASFTGVGLSTSLSLHLTWIGSLTMIGLMIAGWWYPLVIWSRIAGDFSSLTPQRKS